MSTDYGFGCVTCGLEDGRIRERVDIDNMRYHDTKVLRDCLEPGVLEAVALLQSKEMSVRGASEHFYGFDTALAFAAKHRLMGHNVIVCDEYGMAEDACHSHAVCGACGTHQTCTLKQGHVGDCVPPGKKLPTPT